MMNQEAIQETKRKTRKDVNQERDYITKGFDNPENQQVWNEYEEIAINKTIENQADKWTKKNIPQERWRLKAKQSSASIKKSVRKLLEQSGKVFNNLTVEDLEEFHATHEKEFALVNSFLINCVENNLVTLSKDVKIHLIPVAYRFLAE